MGLDINTVRFLIAAHHEKVAFGDVLTLGRQDLNVYPNRVAQLLEQHGLPTEAFRTDGQATLYAEPLFQALGARSISALDASDFEGAAVVHDLNQPIGPELRERFDVVYDGGTLEHVFHFPTALRNCMEMVRVGGHLFLHTPANNWCGHGFYQLSPELFFSALSEENGFAIERMVLHRAGPAARWYEVSDPRKIRARVELVTCLPVLLMIRARRVRSVPVFARTPQQSDYTVRWENATQPGGKDNPYLVPRPRLARVFPGLARLRNVMKMGWVLLRTQTLWNRKTFRPIRKP